MRRTVSALAVVSILPLSASAGAQHLPGVPGWQQRVHYRIAASYAPERFEIAGQETLTYWNESPDTLSDLYFHLYLNAFRPGSNMSKSDAANEDWRVMSLDPKRQGGQWLERVQLAAGDSLRAIVDDTIARISLPRPLLPGDSVAVSLSFRSKIQGLPDRMGRAGRGIFAGYWYPKICAYDRYGWHREQHLGSEFSGDFGTFDVRITLPGSFLLAHTGTLQNPDEVLPDSMLTRLAAPGDTAVTICDMSRSAAPKDSTARIAFMAPRTWVVHADSVHDFAWACDEKWIWRRARAGDVEIHTYHRASDMKRWWDMARIAARMMDAMRERFGPYPYPRFSIVEEPIGAGGVEFPNIVWISQRYRDAHSRRIEEVIAHEMAHNWFYGMVGSNETAQAFLDEGLTSYAESAVIEALYGRRGNTTVPGQRPQWLYPTDDSRTAMWRNYLEFQARGIEEPVVTHSDRFKNPAAYYRSVYDKTSTGLWTLRALAGETRFDEALREYFRTWRFHHPYAEDFFATMNRGLGESYDWFFNGWFLRTDAIDLRLRGLRSFPREPGRAGEAVSSPGALADSFRVEIALESRGGIDPPVILALRDGAGHEARRTVPRDAFLNSAGAALYRTTVPFEPRSAELDPDLTLPDLSRSDNRTGRWPRLKPMVDILRPVPYPLDRTVLLWRPDVWYQAENGPQLGVAFDAATIRWEHGLKGLAGMGARHTRGFFDLEGRLRRLAADPRGIARARAYDIDGHQGWAVSLDRDLGSRIERGFRWKASAGIDHDRLYDADVPRIPSEWSGGGYSNLEAAISSSRRFRNVQWSGISRFRSALLSDEVSYGSLYAVTTATVTAVPALPLSIRAAFGRVRGASIPPEERFYLAGAGPRGEWGSRWFRSRGTIPTRWTAALGGDGNVRGFADARPSGSALFAVNVESRSAGLVPSWLPVLKGIRIPVLEPRSSLFVDVGKVSDDPKNLLSDMAADFGVGFRTKPLIRNRLLVRVDVPVFRTPPGPGEKRWKPRAVVSVGEAF